jgi:hypothetical protein
MGERRDTADRPASPVPSGFRRNGLICVVARLGDTDELFASPSVGK